MYGKGKVDLLSDRTLKELNIDISALSKGSHHKVYVKCTRCSEEFTREFRSLWQLHNCPTRIHRSDGTELKWCNGCSMFLTLVAFDKNKSRYDGLSSSCGTCKSRSPSSKRSVAKRILSRKATLGGWIKAIVAQKKSWCKNHGVECDITAERMLEKWNDQDGKCFYLGIPLQFNGGKLPNAATIERLDSSLGYADSNIVFASRMANLAKNDSNIDDFRDAITGALLNVASDIPRMEVNLRHPDAIVPHRSRASDAGYDIHSLIDISISPGEVVDINTGMAVVAPIGYYLTVEGRSSMFKSGIVPFRGIIDGGYSGDMVVSLMNVGRDTYHIKKGDRVAQIIPHKIIPVDMVKVTHISDDYNIRGTKGFGSSGK